MVPALTTVAAAGDDHGTLPDHLDRSHVDLTGHHGELVYRRVLIAALVVLAGLALGNVFGQRAGTAAAETSSGRLEVRAPHALRGGLVFEARLTVAAGIGLRRPNLVLDPGWFDAMTLNSTEPDAVEWSQANDRSIVALDPLSAGETSVLRLQFQVNPTAIGRREQGVVLRDGDRPVASVERSIVVYP